MKTTNLPTYILGLLLLLCANACGDCSNPKPNDQNDPTGKGGEPQGQSVGSEGGAPAGGIPSPAPGPGVPQGSKNDFTLEDIQAMIDSLKGSSEYHGKILSDFLISFQTNRLQEPVNSLSDQEIIVKINKKRANSEPAYYDDTNKTFLKQAIDSAITLGKTDILQFLLTKGANPDVMQKAIGQWLELAIKTSAQNNQSEDSISPVEQTLLDRLNPTNINVLLDMKTKRNLYIQAVGYKRWTLATELLNKGVDP